MNIAICDDSIKDCDRVKGILVKEATNSVITVYTDGTSFLDATKKNRFDLVFMDVYLKGESGMEVASKLRDISPKTKVAFLTTSDAHAVEAFSLRALHYLVKPVDEDGVREVLLRYEDEDKSGEDTRKSVLSVRIGADIYTIDQADIVKIESDDHKTIIYMDSGTAISAWMRLSDLEKQLDERFLRIRRGTIVNMASISKWRPKDCELIDGTTYLLSRSRRTELKEIYLRFKMEEMEQ